ncbi:TPA: hypothetical protein ACGJ7L_006651 [Pseudomonas aeruginosa]|uniref:hypothetical protein n=1 Tax=Pseudomonas TaxID=286 RepID=UPI00053DF403|nr:MULTISPECIES: hypothetical protein [Pseudomonas]AKE69984.1 hypothetical protein YQ19_17730 [Pseudomonas aeruginosa]ARG51002.1 hypothetical protein BFV99_17200 [Pseudomonas aeruginosa]EIU2564377.1 hypothetical protein [Pseudomonas aeruginosa]EIU2669402.1 hypothetical protein [Pseudomonas aeruginosa]EIU2683014.1 hypothetical protein [Pseudomonas aeruginosa]
MVGDDDSPEHRGDEALRDIRRMLGRDPATGENPVIQQLRANQERVSRVLANLADNQDDRINFRINSVIKGEFDRLCKARGSTLSREIKRIMVEAIRKQKLN